MAPRFTARLDNPPATPSEDGKGHICAMQAALPPQAAPLTKIQATRLRNYVHASAAPEPPLSAAPTVAELAAHPSVTATLLDALDVVPARLLAANASLEQLTALGYGASHLLKSPALAAQMVSKYGHTAAAATVLRCPQDAVELSANTLVLKTLRISTKTLLEVCAGDQASGVCVIHNLLHQHRAAQAAADAANPPYTSHAYPAGTAAATTTATANLDRLQRKLQCRGPLVGVGCETLAKLGLGGRELKEHFGIEIHQLCDVLGTTVDRLQILGVFERPA